jgi:hypothetical protein
VRVVRRMQAWARLHLFRIGVGHKEQLLERHGRGAHHLPSADSAANRHPSVVPFG